MKILTVIGARPQFIKAATVSRALQARGIEEVIVHTRQHFDNNMSDVFFDEMSIPKPNYFLKIGGLSHGAMTGQIIEKIESCLQTEAPDFVLVYGDTNSTLAGAVAASKLHIPVAHVEAGLRSYNMRMPEEVNRILTDRISSKLYCPTQVAIHNLNKEGFSEFSSDVLLTGDVMYDAALYYSQKAEAIPTLEKLKLEPHSFFPSTFHRAENTDNIENLQAIVAALNELSLNALVVVPLHPRTRKIIEKEKINFSFRAIDPMGYLDMINLIKASALVLTDSGGVQKEAYFFNKFCITMRDQTEWVELVQEGVNYLTGANKEAILYGVDFFRSKKFKSSSALYGLGQAADLIADNLFNTQQIKQNY